ncbi:RNA ligase/cyclic nucleotide phosphodiesterase [Aspergillus alliaceus]|uniref:RNA ligase/cyclic nucleotide phosphodiesterase n=1 Tax=Petromyces alliaceus TaxID=209559 RepID=A0A5N7CPE2_PETAA|nr:RNA ligase/cyclic nucleotide phosphodiesterase [Aspergillus alliaceus]
MPKLTTYEDNPFQAELQSRYENHRANRNAQQATQTWHQTSQAGISTQGIYQSSNCLVVWARPTSLVRDLIKFVQNELSSVTPYLWLIPAENLHIKVLEIAYSFTEDQIDSLIVVYSFSYRTRLIKPIVSFDSVAIALSFVPTAGKASDARQSTAEDVYSYHHLCQDIFDIVQAAGTPLASRWLSQEGTGLGKSAVDPVKTKQLTDKIEDINQKLQAEYWPNQNEVNGHGEWLVGQEKGLVIRRGRLWYSGGEDVQVGLGYA